MPTGTSPVDRLAQVALDIFRGVIKHTAHGGDFKGFFTLNIDGVKPTLLVGNAHGSHEDGQVIAVLNPDPELIEQLRPGVAYTRSQLKSRVAGKCDAMICLWIDAYKLDDAVTVRVKYQAKSSTAPKFDVRGIPLVAIGNAQR